MPVFEKEHPFTAVFMGRGVPRKGLHYALRAWLSSRASETGRLLIYGEIDEDFQFNDEYEPSDVSIDMPEPVNELERVLQRIAGGEAPEDELPPAVLAAEVLLYDPENGEGELAVYAAELDDGSQLVPACTSQERVPQSWPGTRRVPGDALPELLAGLDLGLNLDETVRAVIPHSTLVHDTAS